mmetsp:Transcript_78722/g.218723  ORF Transcript_78722/g.218723 Transcript_78722/m.218723 type:complete len:288 (+) Transcript_78722:613-1476(+)
MICILLPQGVVFLTHRHARLRDGCVEDVGRRTQRAVLVVVQRFHVLARAHETLRRVVGQSLKPPICRCGDLLQVDRYGVASRRAELGLVLQAFPQLGHCQILLVVLRAAFRETKLCPAHVRGSLVLVVPQAGTERQAAGLCLFAVHCGSVVQARKTHEACVVHCDHVGACLRKSRVRFRRDCHPRRLCSLHGRRQLIVPRGFDSFAAPFLCHILGVEPGHRVPQLRQQLCATRGRFGKADVGVLRMVGRLCLQGAKASLRRQGTFLETLQAIADDVQISLCLCFDRT